MSDNTGDKKDCALPNCAIHDDQGTASRTNSMWNGVGPPPSTKSLAELVREARTQLNTMRAHYATGESLDVAAVRVHAAIDRLATFAEAESKRADALAAGAVPYPFFYRTAVQRVKTSLHKLTNLVNRELLPNLRLWKQRYKSTKGSLLQRAIAAEKRAAAQKEALLELVEELHKRPCWCHEAANARPKRPFYIGPEATRISCLDHLHPFTDPDCEQQRAAARKVLCN